jgi:hypothetical protein
MLEINQLYRVIGQCRRQLYELQNPVSPLITILGLAAAHKPIIIAFMTMVIVTLLYVRKKQSEA